MLLWNFRVVIAWMFRVIAMASCLGGVVAVVLMAFVQPKLFLEMLRLSPGNIGVFCVAIPFLIECLGGLLAWRWPMDPLPRFKQQKIKTLREMGWPTSH